jgi:hypothetical protein
MAQLKTLSMKEIAAISGKCVASIQQSSPRRIERIARKRVPRGGKMNADLVGSSGLNQHLQEGGIATALKDADPTQCALSRRARGVDRPQEHVRHRSDGRRYGKIGHGRDAAGQSPIDFGYFMPAHGCAKNGPGQGSASKENHSRGASPEAVDGGSPRASLSHQLKERVLKESAAGDGGKSTRLGHRQQLFVFVQNSVTERHISFMPGWAAPNEHLTGFQNGIASGLETIQSDLAVRDALLPVLSGRMAIRSAQIGQDGEPVAAMVDAFPILISPVKKQSANLPALTSP